MGFKRNWLKKQPSIASRVKLGVAAPLAPHERAADQAAPISQGAPPAPADDRFHYVDELAEQNEHAIASAKALKSAVEEHFVLPQAADRLPEPKRKSAKGGAARRSSSRKSSPERP
jgi:hypothetical protein